MRKEELAKLTPPNDPRDNALIFKKKGKPMRSLVLNKDHDRDRDSQHEQPVYKSKLVIPSDDGKSETNKSEKTDKKSLPTLSLPSSNPIKKIFAQKALYDYMKNAGGAGTYQDKETLHQEVIQLKERNNDLSLNNMKLKTKVMNLETENQKMQKMLEEEPETKYSSIKDKTKNTEQTVNALKTMVRDVRKELTEAKEESQKLKKSSKYTRIGELQQERRALQEEVSRLREMLEEQLAENIDFKIRSYNKSQLQQQCSTLQHNNRNLKREIIEYSKKMKALEDRLKPNRVDPDKINGRALADLKKIIKEKNIEIETLKRQREDTQKQPRVGVRSASHNKGKNLRQKCDHCAHYQVEATRLKAKIVELEDKIRQGESHPGSFEDITLKQPTEQELQAVSEFLTYRFKAHHLTFDNIDKYLIKVDSENISVGAMVENLLTEPFFLVHPPYLESIVAYLFYSDSKVPEIRVNESFQKSTTEIKASFEKLIKPYNLQDLKKEQEVFIEISQIITNYCDHIAAAFDSKRNGEGTLSRDSLCEFLRHIELQEEYIEFIITQIVLESSDMEHLNYYALFEIFYLPNNTNQKNYHPPEAVKELDEEYEESQQSEVLKNGNFQGEMAVEEMDYQEDFEDKAEVEELEELIPEDNSI